MARVNQATNETSRQNYHQATVSLAIYSEPFTNTVREVREVTFKPERMCQGWATLNDFESTFLRHMARWRGQKCVQVHQPQDKENMHIHLLIWRQVSKPTSLS